MCRRWIHVPWEISQLKTCTRVLEGSTLKVLQLSVGTNEACSSTLRRPDVLHLETELPVKSSAGASICSGQWKERNMFDLKIFHLSLQESCIEFLCRTAATTVAYTADIGHQPAYRVKIQYKCVMAGRTVEKTTHSLHSPSLCFIDQALSAVIVESIIKMHQMHLPVCSRTSLRRWHVDIYER